MTAVADRTLSAAKIRGGMTVKTPEGAWLRVTVRAIVKSELHGLFGVVKEPDKIWLFFNGRRMLELDPKERMEVMETTD